MTDSVTRLYSAYFLRPPDTAGFDFWATRWGGGEWDLPRISAFFSQSPEFDSTYGALSDAEFVELVYENVLDRAPDAGGRDYWTAELAGGLDRGHMMLLFSESEEYYVASGTVPFFGGAFKTLPRGATFYCGSGQQVIEVSYDNRANVFVTAFAEVLPSDDDFAGGNFIGNVLDAELNRVGNVANEIVYWNRPESAERSVTRTEVLRYFSFYEPGVKLEVGDEDADEMRWWFVFYPDTTNEQPFS